MWLLIGVVYFSLQSEDRFESKYNDVPSRNSSVSQVVIRDVTALMPLHYSLAQGYTWVQLASLFLSRPQAVAAIVKYK